MSQVLWHPKAKRITLPDAGPIGEGGAKFVVHSTEGSTADGAVSAYRSSGNSPHFTLGYAQGGRVLYQHVPINHAATALKHTLPEETNRAKAIQVEVVGFAAQSPKWPKELYRYLHLLLIWCHRHGGVPLEAHHPFIGQDGYHRLSGPGWVKTSGVVGHCHCPGNDHTDPGNLDRAKVLRGA